QSHRAAGAMRHKVDRPPQGSLANRGDSLCQALCHFTNMLLIKLVGQDAVVAVRPDKCLYMQREFFRRNTLLEGVRGGAEIPRPIGDENQAFRGLEWIRLSKSAVVLSAGRATAECERGEQRKRDDQATQ